MAAGGDVAAGDDVAAGGAVVTVADKAAGRAVRRGGSQPLAQIGRGAPRPRHGLGPGARFRSPWVRCAQMRIAPCSVDARDVPAAAVPTGAAGAAAACAGARRCRSCVKPWQRLHSVVRFATVLAPPALRGTT